MNEGYFKSCDFSEAILKEALFINTDIQEIEFPKWPSYTIVFDDDLAENIENVKDSSLKERFKNLLDYKEEWWSDDCQLTASTIQSSKTINEVNTSEEKLLQALKELKNSAIF